MTRDTLNLPTTRSWRDIPQPVVPRAMSREGRWRLVMSSLRLSALLVLVGTFAWGVWVVAVSVRENTKAMPAVAKAIPMKAPELRTDGVLSDAWLARTLALRPNISLAEIDLQKLRVRLLAEPQVINATLTKQFPDRLIVQIAERSPIARVMVQWLGQKQALLVARDGVVYAGEGYDRSVLDTLPYLDGVNLVPAGGGFQPIAGMEVTADLLGKARLEAEHLYATWQVVSLARLENDHKLEIHARSSDWERTIFFSTTDDFFRQLAKLDYISDSLAGHPPGESAVIDLSLGQDVPVMITAPVSPDVSAKRPAPPEPVKSAAQLADVARPFDFMRPTDTHSEPALFLLPPSQPRKTKREL